MTEFPAGTPQWLIDALTAINDKMRTNLLDPAKSSDIWRGYFMAICDLQNEIETQVAIEQGRIEENKLMAAKAYLEQSGKPT